VCIVTAALRISSYITFSDMRLSAFSHCRKLCELEVRALGRNEAELKLLSSITSTKIEKIIITHSASFWFLVGQAYWTQLDDILNRLVGQLEQGLGLEVEFRKMDVPEREIRPDLGKFLPMFMKKGRVKVFIRTGCYFKELR
jgi:hypothetical protein